MLPELRIWLNHFEYHAEHPRSMPEGIADVLSDAERRLIARSIATFQLGERSQGAMLMRAAQRCAALHRDSFLVRIVELFIREEQRHAAVLREFMEDHAIPERAGDWTDWVFRRIRCLGGFELYLNVLISAELIGIVYYRALEAATGCRRLQVLCRTLVCEELAHVGFESQLLGALREPRPAALRHAARVAHRLFFAGTAVVVWFTQHELLRAAGYDARSFLRACLAQHSFHLDPAPATLPSAYSG